MNVQLGDACHFLNEDTPSKSIPSYFEGTIPWITGADIAELVVRSARSFITEEAIANSATNRVAAGTVLLVTRTSVGKVAIAGMDLCFSQDITAFKPNADKLDTAYLVHFLRIQEAHLDRQARRTTIKEITRNVVESLEISLGGISAYHAEYKAFGSGVLLGRKGSVGRVHYVEEDYWPHDTTLWVKDFQENNPIFVDYFFKRFPIADFEESTSNSTLNRNRLHPVNVFWSPLLLQQEFARRVEAIEHLKATHRESLTQLDALFASLQHRAFSPAETLRERGEL